jgi:hypothetical protein
MSGNKFIPIYNICYNLANYSRINENGGHHDKFGKIKKFPNIFNFCEIIKQIFEYQKDKKCIKSIKLNNSFSQTL